MKEEKTIFQKLEKQNVCFAIGISRIHISLTSDHKDEKFTPDISSPDYFIIGSIKDKTILKELDFLIRSSLRSHPKVMEYDMNNDEIRECKKMMLDETLIKTLHTKDGKIYELKENSFSDYVL